MRCLKTVSFILFLVLGSSCQQVGAAPQEMTSSDEGSSVVEVSDSDILREYLQLNARIENISYGILRANVDSCPQTAPHIGISVHMIRDYPENMQAIASNVTGVGELPQIRHVVEGSAAHTAGLRKGDTIESIGQHKLIEGGSARQFYEGVSRLEFSLGQVSMKILRGDEAITVKVLPEKLCGYAVELLVADYINAYTDGEGIWLTTELVNATEDDLSLALILAHELAHATEGHMFKNPTKALEVEADFIGMQYLLRAGLDGEAALASWIANPFNHEARAELTHPAPDERITAMKRALRRVRD